MRDLISKIYFFLHIKTYCKEVAFAIKKVIAAGEELKAMEEDEEEEWIEQEAEELAAIIKNKTLLLVRSASTAIKEVTDATTLPKTQEEAFVKKAKETLNCLHELLLFCGSLGLKEEEELRVSFRIFLQSAKQVYQGSANSAQLEASKDTVAKVMRSVVLSASALNTTELVRNRLFQEDPPKPAKGNQHNMLQHTHTHTHTPLHPLLLPHSSPHLLPLPPNNWIALIQLYHNSGLSPIESYGVSEKPLGGAR